MRDCNHPHVAFSMNLDAVVSWSNEEKMDLLKMDAGWGQRGMENRRATCVEPNRTHRRGLNLDNGK